MKYEEYDSLIMGEENAICYIADCTSYEILHITRQGMRLYELHSPEDYLGKKCYKILQGLDAPCPFCNNAKLREGEKYHWEHYYEKLGRWMDITDSMVIIDGRACRLERAHDITEQKLRFKRLSDQLTVEEILVQCIQILASEDDYDMAFNRFLERLGRFYRANRAYIFEFDLRREFTDNTYEWCAPGISAEIDNLQHVPVEYISQWVQKFQKDGEFFITCLDEHVDKTSPDYRILAAQGIQSLLAAPLCADGEIVGFIGVDDPTAHTDDLTLLRASTDFVLEELKKRRMINRLAHVSYTDTLTGLNNRNKYMEVLNFYETRTPDTLGVIFVDINGMKTINDTYGHKFGDKLLVRVADILKKVVPEQIYRIGGDEFVILLEDLPLETFHEKVHLLRLAFESDENCNVSIGSAWQEEPTDANHLISHADELMYAEKQGYYKSVLAHGQSVRVGISREVIEELKKGRFLVFYQPQINMKNSRIIGAEALVRKKGPDGALIAPDKFISYYEAEGVIRHVDLFVLEEVCATMQKWQKKQIYLNISVNFSRVTLMETDIVDTILGICQKYQISPQYLTIEVTENISKLDPDHLRDLMCRLIGHGFTISLDDFGSKYSNLSILNDMDFHTVKIDRSLVKQLEVCEKSRIIMKNTIRMCQEMDSTHTLAEGIETKGQMELLSKYNCEYGQGYYFSRPLSLTDFNKTIGG